MPPRQRTHPPGAIYETAEAFQAALDADMDAAQDRMLSAWEGAYERSRTELQGILDKIRDAEEAGTPLSPAWLYQRERLQNATATIEREMTRAMGEATAATTEAQAQAAALSAQGSADLVREAADMGVSAQRADVANLAASFVQINEANTRHLVGFLQDGSPLNDLFQQLAMETRIQVREALVDGLTLGKGPVWMARQVTAALDMPRHRAVTIMRTETMRTYRAVARETYQANADVLEGWTWHAKLAASTCAACLAMHGTVHPVTETLDGHPRCRCAMVPRTKSWDEILGEDSGIPDTRPPVKDGKAWLAEQPERTQRAILGPAKLKAWQDGKITLDDVVARTQSRTWGTMRRERSLIEIEQGRNANTLPGPEDFPAAQMPTAQRLAYDGRSEWERWDTDRDVDHGQVMEQHQLEGLEYTITTSRRDVERAEEYLAQAKASLKAEQARLKSYVPDAKERAKWARKDTGILNARSWVKHAEEDLAHYRDRLAQVEAERARGKSMAEMPRHTADNPLAGYGNRLVISDRHARTHQHLRDFEEHLPAHHHQALRDNYAQTPNGGMYVGQELLPDMDDLSDLRRAKPRGWAEGSSWDEVGGVYSPQRRVNAVSERGWRGTHDGELTHATMIHEAGHAMDHAHRTVLGRTTDASQAPEWSALAQPIQAAGPRPYYTPLGNPSGHLSELWAESFNGWATGRGKVTVEARARHLLRTVEARETPESVKAAEDVVAYFDALDAELAARV